MWVCFNRPPVALSCHPQPGACDHGHGWSTMWELVPAGGVKRLPDGIKIYTRGGKRQKHTTYSGVKLYPEDICVFFFIYKLVYFLNKLNTVSFCHFYRFHEWNMLKRISEQNWSKSLKRKTLQRYTYGVFNLVPLPIIMVQKQCILRIMNIFKGPIVCQIHFTSVLGQ